jgi:acetolactate synthase-1/2/3 large subunit
LPLRSGENKATPDSCLVWTMARERSILPAHEVGWGSAMGRPEEMRAGEWFARALAGAGVTHVFFVDAILRDALIEMAPLGVERVLTHSEKTAAYMADGYARVAGRPGVCLAQSVGAANLASGLQDAWLGRSPVIAITGQKPPSSQHRNAYQEVPHAPSFAPVTKFSAEVAAAEDLPRLLRQAWRAAITGSPRPVHLDLRGLQAEFIQSGSVAESVPPATGLAAVPLHRPLPPPGEIARAAAALAAARRVAIVAGAGAVVSGAGSELLAVAERLGAPIATSTGGRGVVPTRHRLSVGVLGHYSAPPANQIIHEADLVLFVGCHAGDLTTDYWRIPRPETPVVQIDLDPVELGRNYADTIGLMGDPKATLAALAEALPATRRPDDYAERAAGLVAGWREEMASLLRSDATPIRVERLCAEVTRALPANGILVADTGHSTIWTSTLVELDGAGQTYLRAAGSLGWAFPASLGAKCAAPDRPVICFTGDGGFYYHIGELETARRRNIPVVIVVNNNSGLGQCLPGIRKMQGNRPGAMSDLLMFEKTDFAAIARGFGVRGVRVEDPARIGSALDEALAAGAPTVIDVVTDIEAWPPQPWSPPA